MKIFSNTLRITILLLMLFPVHLHGQSGQDENDLVMIGSFTDTTSSYFTDFPVITHIALHDHYLIINERDGPEIFIKVFDVSIPLYPKMIVSRKLVDYSDYGGKINYIKSQSGYVYYSLTNYSWQSDLHTTEIGYIPFIQFPDITIRDFILSSDEVSVNASFMNDRAAVSNQLHYTSDRGVHYRRIGLFESSQVSEFTEIGEIEQDVLCDVLLDERYIYAFDSSRTAVYDWNTRGLVTELPAARNILKHDRYLLIINMDGSISIMDTGPDISLIEELSRIYITAGKTVLSGNSLFVKSDSMHVFNISDPTAPKQVVSKDITFKDYAVTGNLLFGIRANDNEENEPDSIDVWQYSGAGSAEILLWDPAPDFGIILAGDTSCVHTVRITNVKSGALELDNITVGSEDFSYTGDVLPLNVPASALYSLPFRFHPDSPGRETADILLEFTNSASNFRLGFCT